MHESFVHLFSLSKKSSKTGLFLYVRKEMWYNGRGDKNVKKESGKYARPGLNGRS